jgi:hypothetical protein
MGWWNSTSEGQSLQPESTGIIWGDGPADILGPALASYGKKGKVKSLIKECEKIGKQFEDGLQRPPTKQEMIAGVLFEFAPLRRYMDTLKDGPAPSSHKADLLDGEVEESID